MSDPPAEDPFPAAWAAVGKLTTFWAELESSLFQELRVFVSGDESDSDAVAYALVAGLRWDEMLRAFKQVVGAKGSEEAAAILADIGAEANRVKGIRNLAAHNRFHIGGSDTLVFHLSGRMPETSRHACYTLEELERCADYALCLATRVRHELNAALRGEPIAADSEPLRSWREKPALPGLPAAEPHRDSRQFFSTDNAAAIAV